MAGVKVRSRSLKDTECLAGKLLALIAAKKWREAAVIVLSGDLGSGKTTFVQLAGRIMGVLEPIQSPTFVIEKIYPIKWQQFKKLVHIDAYRLERGVDLSALRFEERAADHRNLIFIEWPERVRDVLRGPLTFVTFSIAGDGVRDIEIHEDDNRESASI